MNETTESNTPSALHTVDGVKLRCHILVDRIAKRPGAIKLLLCAERALQTFANYKANRAFHNSDRTL